MIPLVKGNAASLEKSNGASKGCLIAPLVLEDDFADDSGVFSSLIKGGFEAFPVDGPGKSQHSVEHGQ